MFISKKQLSRFLETEAVTTDQLVEALTNLAYEVEQVIKYDNISGVKFGKIISCIKHPNADTLSLLEVDTDGKIYTVVCGGANAAKGQIVAHAIPGSRVGELIMAPKVLRGIESAGMILSISEIGGIDKSLVEEEEKENIYVFAKDQDMSLDPADVIGLKDEIIEVNILPDRQYASSYREIARELSAYLGINFGNVTIPYLPKELDDSEYSEPKIILGKNAIKINVLFAHLTGVGKTEQFIKNTLYAAKIQPTDTFNDILIYVRLLKGNVTYVFDFLKEIKLDGSKLNEIDIFADGLMHNKTNKITLVGIASDEKANVVKLAKVNYPMGISNTKGTKFANVQLAAIVKYGFECGYIDKISPKAFIKVLQESKESKIIKMEKQFITQYIGEKIPLHEVLIKLAKIRIIVDKGNWFVPYDRVDLETKQDLIEEIVRFYGINKINPILPKIIKKPPQINLKKEAFQNVSKLLINLGINEAKTYQLVTKEQAEKYNLWDLKTYSQLREDYSAENNTLQTSLMFGLIEVYKYNYRKEYKDIAFFEFANIFDHEVPNYSVGIIIDDIKYEDPALALKEMVLRIIELIAPNSKKIDFLELDIALFNKFNAVAIEVNHQTVALIGELHPSLLREHKFIRIDKVKQKLYYAEINIEKLLK